MEGERFINVNLNKFKCIDEPIEIYGDYNSWNSVNLVVVFELCTPEKRSTCKNDREISDAIGFSYIVILENKQEYRHEEYPGSENMIRSYSEINWHPMSKKLEMQNDYPKKV